MTNKNTIHPLPRSAYSMKHIMLVLYVFFLLCILANAVAVGDAAPKKYTSRHRSDARRKKRVRQQAAANASRQTQQVSASTWTGPSYRFFADYASESCLQDCMPGPFGCAIVPPPIPLYDSVDTCCSVGQTWVDNNYCRSRSQGQYTNLWYVDYASGSCRQDTGPQHDDGSLTLYNTVNACCQAKLGWISLTMCAGGSQQFSGSQFSGVQQTERFLPVETRVQLALSGALPPGYRLPPSAIQSTVGYVRQLLQTSLINRQGITFVDVQYAGEMNCQQASMPQNNWQNGGTANNNWQGTQNQNGQTNWNNQNNGWQQTSQQQGQMNNNWQTNNNNWQTNQNGGINWAANGSDQWQNNGQNNNNNINWAANGSDQWNNQGSSQTTTQQQGWQNQNGQTNWNNQQQQTTPLQNGWSNAGMSSTNSCCLGAVSLPMRITTNVPSSQAASASNSIMQALQSQVSQITPFIQTFDYFSLSNAYAQLGMYDPSCLGVASAVPPPQPLPLPQLIQPPPTPPPVPRPAPAPRPVPTTTTTTSTEFAFDTTTTSTEWDDWRTSSTSTSTAFSETSSTTSSTSSGFDTTSTSTSTSTADSETSSTTSSTSPDFDTTSTSTTSTSNSETSSTTTSTSPEFDTTSTTSTADSETSSTTTSTSPDFDTTTTSTTMSPFDTSGFFRSKGPIKKTIPMQINLDNVGGTNRRLQSSSKSYVPTDEDIEFIIGVYSDTIKENLERPLKLVGISRPNKDVLYRHLDAVLQKSFHFLVDVTVKGPMEKVDESYPELRKIAEENKDEITDKLKEYDPEVFRYVNFSSEFFDSPGISSFDANTTPSEKQETFHIFHIIKDNVTPDALDATEETIPGWAAFPVALAVLLAFCCCSCCCLARCRYKKRREAKEKEIVDKVIEEEASVATTSHTCGNEMVLFEPAETSTVLHDPEIVYQHADQYQSSTEGRMTSHMPSITEYDSGSIMTFDDISVQGPASDSSGFYSAVTYDDTHIMDPSSHSVALVAQPTIYDDMAPTTYEQYIHIV